MHLMNVLNQLEANLHEKDIIIKNLEGKIVTHSAVAEELHKLRTS